MIRTRNVPIPTAPALWGTVVAWVLVNDAVLVAQGRETMSQWFSRHALPLTLVTGYLLLHLYGRPRRFAAVDPLHLAAQFIRAHGGEPAAVLIAAVIPEDQ